MSGEHVRDDVPLYALGLLDGAERTAVERHLATCPPCRAELAAEDLIVGELASAVARAPSQGLREAIVTRHRRRSWLPITLPRSVIAIAVAAVAVVAIGLTAVEDVVRLEPQARTDAGNAAVVVARNGEAYMILGLSAVPSDQAYQAWVIRDGSAIPAGLGPAGQGIVVIALGVALLPGDVAAVTIEPAAGVRAPTTDPILVGVRGRS